VEHSAESGQFFFIREEAEELYKMVKELKELRKKPKIVCDEKFWLGEGKL
jgi:glutaredoxin